MASRFLRSFVALVLGVCSLQANAIEFRGAEYEVYIGDVNGDGINDVYLKVPDVFVLLHGDISVPLFISSDEPSFLIESLDAQSPLYLDPVVDENVDVSTLAKSTDIASLIDVNGDGVLDISFTSPSIIYDFSLDGGALEEPLIVSAAIPVPSLSRAAVDPADDDTTAHGDFNGLIKAINFVDKNGAFNINIPIPVSPGINGVQPKISLAYNSHSKNGIVGWGWNLKTGASNIGRCGANIVRDGYRSGIQTEEQFKFCLDGRRLVEVSQREYRTERESFSRIKSYGGTERNPDYWTVENSNGTILTYGQSFSARGIDGLSGDVDFSNRLWSLDRIENLSGNYMEYRYDSYYPSIDGGVGNGRVRLLSSIAYGKNGTTDLERAVSFEYEDRPDIREYFIGGEFVTKSRRLKTISLQKSLDGFGVSEVFMQYNLEYYPVGTGLMPQVSRLYTLEQCSVSGDVSRCGPVKKMVWEDEPETLSQVKKVDRNYYGEGDFDGDGKLDTLEFKKYEEITYIDGELWAGEAVTVPARWTVSKISVDDSQAPESWLKVPQSDVEFSIRPTIMDINGDGLDDLVFTDLLREDGYQASLRVLRSTGSSFIYEVWADPSNNFGTDHAFSKQLMDINGDGLIDLVLKHHELGIHIRLNNGNGGFEDWSEWWPPYFQAWDDPIAHPTEPNTTPRALGSFIDITGDGLPDFVACDDYTVCGVKDGVNNTVVLENVGDSFSRNDSWVLEESRHGLTRLADVNGDGLVDYLAFRGTALYVQLNTGNGFSPSIAWLTINPITDYRRIEISVLDNDVEIETKFHSHSITFVDVNADGCKDMIARAVPNISYGEDEGVKAYVSYSSCSSTEGFSKLTRLMGDELFVGTGRRDEDYMLTGDLAIGVNNTNGKIWNFSAVFSADIDRDGVPELAGDKFVWFTNVSRHLLTDVMDFTNLSSSGASKTISIDYKPLANSDVYSGDGLNFSGGKNRDGSDYHNAVLQISPLMLVEKITNDFLPPKTYKYSNYRVDRRGWGRIGFEKIIETVYPHGITNTDAALNDDFESAYQRTEKRYTQLVSNDFSLAGKLESISVYISKSESADEQLVADTKYRWKVRSYNDDLDHLPEVMLNIYSSPHYFPYLYESITENWDLNGQKVGVKKSGVAAASSNNCLVPSDFSLIKTNFGSAGDVDLTENGLLLEKREITCDEVESSASGLYTATKITEYEDRTSAEQWLLGLPKNIVTRSYVGAVSTTANFESEASNRTSAYAYNTLGLLETETIEPDNNELRVTSTYDYNSFGVRNSITQSWVSQTNDGLDYGNTRTSGLTESYSENSELTQVVTNFNEQDVTSKIKAEFGNTVSKEDLNGLETTFDYDDFGRVVIENMPGSIVTIYQYKLCDSCFSYNNSALYYVSTKTTGQTAARVYFDAFDREVGSRTQNIDGAFIYTYKTYDLLGRVTASSAPFFTSETVAETAFFYDLLGRNTTTAFPDSSSSNITYNGLKKTITNRDEQSRKVTVNMAGWDVEAEDAAETKIAYKYSNFGDLTTTTVNDDDATKVSIGYDLLGRRTSIDDPDAGYTSYTLNPIGLVAKETDANNTVTRYSYDELDRVVSRTDDADTPSAQTHQWVFDSKLHGLGMLGSLRGFDSDGGIYNEEYSFTSLSLQEGVTITIDGASYVTHTHYDNFQRIKGITYPTGFTYQNEYNEYGYLHRTEKLDGSLLWRANTMDARGNFTQFEYGNSVVSDQTFDPDTGVVETIKAHVNGDGYTVQDHEYDFSSLGNLNYRIDHKFGITESFCYDSMNRIKAARIGSCSESDTDFTYDVLGNIRSKDGVSDYAYTSGRPHAVSRFDGSNYEYDDAGQMLSGGGRSISYTDFGKPSYFSKGNNWASFTYDANKNRIARSDSNGKDTTYIGLGFYEINRSNDDTQHIHYIGDYARYVIETGLINDDYFVYLHRDHLGSIVAESGENVSFVSTTSEWMGFSPWGERLSQDWSGSELGESYVPDKDSRGFTDHEHIDGVGLIHMNGRVYDPVMGRFLTPDPLVQAPNNTQSYNRYSYVFNNPLSFVDPSGYEADPIIYDGDVIGRDPGNIMEIQNLYYTIDGASSPEPFAEDMTISPASSIIVTLGAGAVVCPVICPWAVGVGSFISDPADPLNLLGGWLKSVKLFKWFGRGKTAGQIGRAGEDAVSAVFNIGKKQKFSINGRNRIPDGVTSTTLSEVKNVKSLSYTKQLRDFADIAKQQGLKYDLYVRPSTKLSGPLSQAIENGVINLKFIPGAK